MTATAAAAVWARGGSFSLRDNSHMPEMRARVDVPCHGNKIYDIQYSNTLPTYFQLNYSALNLSFLATLTHFLTQNNT
jgi:hypothetical protein